MLNRFSIKLLILPPLILALSACNFGNNMFFKGKDALLEKAIEVDNASAVKDAIKQGANPNAVGLHGVTPIIITAGNLKFNAMQALIESGSNPNIYDKNGDNALSLAITTYKKDKRSLILQVIPKVVGWHKRQG